MCALRLLTRVTRPPGPLERGRDWEVALYKTHTHATLVSLMREQLVA